jgi:demethylmenaquinone methyltransferase/2-methoxy-6-polyprenyl-1,4-benzoquinol methylase
VLRSPAAPTAEQVQSLFNRIAPAYDRLNGWLSLGQHWVWKQMAVSWSQAKVGDTCLDLCCGSGDLALLLGKQVGSAGQVVGLDFAEAQLAIAAQRSYHLPQIRWQQGDALALPFPDQTFNAITMGYGLRNVTDIPACLSEIQRVLRSGGKAAILDFNHPENAFVEGFQQWYLQTIMIPAAKNLGLTEEYAYLVPSLARFPTGAEQVKLAQQAGFTEAVHYAIAAGMMGVLVLKKKS